MSKTDEITKKLETITDFIGQAQIKLQQGKVINLTHLDGEVAQLCNETLQLPPADAQRIQPIMGNMINRLEELGIALQDFQANLKNTKT